MPHTQDSVTFIKSFQDQQFRYNLEGKKSCHLNTPCWEIEVSTHVITISTKEEMPPLLDDCLKYTIISSLLIVYCKIGKALLNTLQTSYLQPRIFAPSLLLSAEDSAAIDKDELK
ncbi:hypothetical protein C0J52_11436 [Blattella germanica]|nr:hypothetical protein C0J52_11436 [Blattella germanica]